MSNSIQSIAMDYIENPDNKNCLTLYNRLFPGLRKFIVNMLSNDNIYDKYDVINDIISSTFYQIISYIHTYNNEYQFSTWVYAITKNEVLIFLNANNRSVTRGLNDIYKLDNYLINNKRIDIDEDEIEKYDPLENIENENDIEFLINKTKDCIEELPEIYKGIIEDRDIYCVKYIHLEKKYDIPLNTVKSRIKLGRKILYNKMKKRHTKIYKNIEF